MMVVIVRDGRGRVTAISAKLTASLSDHVGQAFTDRPADAFSLRLRKAFPMTRLRSYRVSRTKNGHRITFSRMQQPRCVTYRGEEIAVAEEDTSEFYLELTETQTMPLTTS